MKCCPPKLRDTAYISLVRPILEYGCTIWSPYTMSGISKIARFVTGKFKYCHSVSDMLHDLGWPTRRNVDKKRDWFFFIKSYTEFHMCRLKVF